MLIIRPLNPPILGDFQSIFPQSWGGQKTSINLADITFQTSSKAVKIMKVKISATQTEIIFQMVEVSKIYQMGEVKVQALKSINLVLKEGELVVLLGPSGSGKSTLLNILGGLDVPTSGQVWFRNRNLTTADEATLTRFRRHHVGFVFQFYNLIPSLTARENVALVTEIAPHPMGAQEALGLVGLEHRLDHFPSQLSGGEQQRVAIARAIAKRPQVLLCDEPTGALDFQTGKRVLEAIERVNQEFGTTTAIVTHNAGIARMADRVIVMGSGEIVKIKCNEVKVVPGELEW